MKRVLALLILVVGLVMALKCPVDDLALFFDGNTQVIEGRQFWEYRCARGHVYWVRQ